MSNEESADLVQVLTRLAVAQEESNTIASVWIATQTKWHEEEYARWQRWREEDLERLARAERALDAVSEEHIKKGA